MSVPEEEGVVGSLVIDENKKRRCRGQIFALEDWQRKYRTEPERGMMCKHSNHAAALCLLLCVCPNEVDSVQSFCSSQGTRVKRRQCQTAQNRLHTFASSSLIFRVEERSFTTSFRLDLGRLLNSPPRSIRLNLRGSRAKDDEATGLQKDADAVRSVLDELKRAGTAKQWSSLSSISRRTTFIRELTTLGIKNAEQLAIPSVRNDVAFLATVVGTTSVLAVLASQLPGDWGFFVPYLMGGISLVVLAVGSIAPGLLQAAISSFSSIYPDYKERLLRHEAAHFLVAYFVGLPIVGYSIDIGKEHVNLLDEKLQERIYQGSFDARELDKLAVVSMAGLAAEGLKYDKVEGQSADLYSLQRLINRSKPPMNNKDQQNLTRWAAHYAASLLKNKSKAFEALQEAMGKKASVVECIEAIEKAS